MLDAQTWTAAAVPDLSGRTAVVTGASAGLGLETARVLAGRGAKTVLACRDLGKAAAGERYIRAHHPAADVTSVRLDLASQSSVHTAADELLDRCDRIDILVNNAGVMEVPYERTADGFELTLATNHLGPFALTGRLLDRLLRTPGSRVVTVSSEGHRTGAMRFDDLHGTAAYRPDAAYEQSKLANLLFTYEFDRRLRAAGVGTRAVASHPGVVLTHLFHARPLWNRILFSSWLRPLNFWVVQSPEMGALPTLRAAVDETAEGGDFFGPTGRGFAGFPARVESSPASHDRSDQQRLWDISEQLTGVTYDLDLVTAPATAEA
jgi:NAD(P)-dependent dehydrogenase (short-subunit alcohol dehydrogenase family)